MVGSRGVSSSVMMSWGWWCCGMGGGVWGSVRSWVVGADGGLQMVEV